jgi:hypothetical protein
MSSNHVAAVLAYNRRDLTLACPRSLRAQNVPDLVVDAHLLDDASVNGTGAAIARLFPDVRLLHGDGTFYWNGGMQARFAAAMQGDYDWYLWLNDDVRLDGNAVRLLLETERELTERTSVPVLASRTTRDPVTGEVPYGGVVHPHRWRPLRSVLVQPGDQPPPCDTMYGNVVLVPRDVTRRIENIHPAFVQLMGDFDDGLRPHAAGCSVWLARVTVGTCPQDPPHDGSLVRSLLPGLFAAAVVALAVGLLRMTLSSEVSSPLALLAAEFLLAALAYAIGVRVWPLPDARRELWSSASTFGALGRVGPWRWRLALLVLGPPGVATTGGQPP